MRAPAHRRAPAHARAAGLALAAIGAITAGCGGSHAGASPGVESDEAADDAGASLAPRADAGKDAAGACAEPTGAWTGDVGGTLPSTLAWTGLGEQSWASGTVRASDYLDCDGSRGIRAVLVDQSVVWCEACGVVAKDIAKRLPVWSKLGIKVITLMIEDAEHQPAGLQTAIDWKRVFDLEGTAVVYDAIATLPPPGGGMPPMPALYVVDPRTLRVVNVQYGWTGDYSQLEQLATDNAAR